MGVWMWESVKVWVKELERECESESVCERKTKVFWESFLKKISIGWERESLDTAKMKDV